MVQIDAQILLRHILFNSLLHRRSRYLRCFTHWCCPSVFSVCLSPKRILKNAIFSKTKQFRIWSLLQEDLYGLFKEPIIGSLKFKMAEIQIAMSTKMHPIRWTLVHNRISGTGWQSRDQIRFFKIQDGGHIPHFKNRFLVITQRRLSNFSEILLSEADYNGDRGHVT